MTKYFIDQAGRYLGGFDGEDVVTPDGGVEVPHAPGRASDLWIDDCWVTQISADEFNAPILAQLDVIDFKSIRPLREGDAARVAALEQEAAVLRLQLRKD